MRNETFASCYCAAPDEEWVKCAENLSGVTKFWEKTLGMTAREFTSSYCCGQNDLARITSMRPMERQQFVRELMGIGVLDEGIKELRVQERETTHAAEQAIADESTSTDITKLQLEEERLQKDILAAEEDRKAPKLSLIHI